MVSSARPIWAWPISAVPRWAVLSSNTIAAMLAKAPIAVTSSIRKRPSSCRIALRRMWATPLRTIIANASSRYSAENTSQPINSRVGRLSEAGNSNKVATPTPNATKVRDLA